MPIGLVEMKGHTAVQVATYTEGLMVMVGFQHKDLCASVNDNTNSAVLAREYIIGQSKGGKCNMHHAELILEHAADLAIRKQGRVAMDQNKEFVAVYSKFYKFVSWLMTKHSNSHFDNV